MTRIRIRHFALCVSVTASLCVAVPSSALAAKTTAQQIQRAAERGQIDSAAEVLNGLRSYAAPDRVPTALRGAKNAKSRELSMLLRQAQRAVPRLSDSEQSEVGRYLMRPAELGNGDTLCDDWSLFSQPAPYDSPGGQFKIHWVENQLAPPFAAAADAPPSTDDNTNGTPDYVELVASTLDSVHASEVSALGWADPPSDVLEGGDAKSDVYLCELTGNSVYGYVANDPGAGRSLPSYMVLDDDFLGYPRNQLDSLQVTAAHEYNHMIQYGYDVLQDTWMMEATSTWMEERVYPAVNDYVGYIPFWAANPQSPLTTADGAREYGSMVWNLWLADVEGWGQQVVRSAWQKSSMPANSVDGGGFAPAAYSDAIDDVSVGGSFSESFGRFAVAMAEWKDELPARFDEAAANYPDLTRAGQMSVGATATLPVNHTAFQLVDVIVPASGPVRMRISSGDVSAPIASSLAALVGRKPTGEVVAQLAIIPNDDSATLTLTQAGQFSRITAVIVNRDVAHSGWNVSDWGWSNDGIAYSLRIDGGNLPPAASFSLGGEAIVGSPTAFTAASTDPNPGDTLSHSWDLDNDGQFDDATGLTAAYSYLLPGEQTARLRTVDEFGASGEYSLVFPVRATALAEDPSGTDQPPVVRANLARLPRVKKGRMRLKFSASEDVRMTGTIKYGRRQIAKASAKGTAAKKSVISFKLKKKYWKLLRKRKKLKVTVTLTALDSTNQKFSDKRKTLIRKG